MDQTAQKENQEKLLPGEKLQLNPVVSKPSPLITKLIIVIAVLAFGIGLFFLGYKMPKSDISGKRSETATPQTQNTDVPYGDEDFQSNPDYKKAMEYDPQTGLFTSYFGYSLMLEPGWKKIDSMTISDGSLKREAFTSLSDKEVKSYTGEDPYNPSYYLEVEITDNPDNVSLDQWTADSNYSPQGLGQQVTSVKIGAYDAVKINGNQGEGYVDYYISQGNKIYNLGYFYNASDGQWQSPPGFTPEVFEKIISSFYIAGN